MHRYTPGKLAFWTLSESWRFGSDDFADFNWAIFRFKHANFQRCNVPPLSFYRVCLTILMKVFPWDRWFSYGCQLIPQLCDVRISNVLRCNESVNIFSNVKFRFFFRCEYSQHENRDFRRPWRITKTQTKTYVITDPWRILRVNKDPIIRTDGIFLPREHIKPSCKSKYNIQGFYGGTMHAKSIMFFGGCVGRKSMNCSISIWLQNVYPHF